MEVCSNWCTDHWRRKTEIRGIRLTSVSPCLRRNPRGIESQNEETLARSATVSDRAVRHDAVPGTVLKMYFARRLDHFNWKVTLVPPNVLLHFLRAGKEATVK